MDIRNTRWFVMPLVLVGFIHHSQAVEVSASVSSNVEYSDNIRLRSQDKVEDFVQNVGLTVGVKEARKNFQADASFNVGQEHYYNGTFSDRNSITTGIGLFNFDLVESFLNWRSSYTSTQVLTDNSALDTPDNREQRNVLRTGPEISVEISKVSRVDLTAKYTNVENSDENSSDSERANATLNFTRLLNSLTSVSLGGQYEEIIDPDELEKYKSVDVNIGLNRHFVKGEMQFTYGRTRLTPEFSQETNSNFFSVLVKREEVLRHIVSLQYLQDISDTSVGFTVDETSLLDSATTTLRSASLNDVVERKRYDLTIRRDFDVYTYSLTAFWENQDYIHQLNDEKSNGGKFRFGQEVSSGLNVGYEFTYRSNDFVDQPTIGRDKTTVYQVDSTYNISKEFFLNGFIRYTNRANTTSGDREYEDLTTNIGVEWKFL